MCKQLANSLPASQGYMKKEVGWGKPRTEKDISTTDLSYLSPSQKAWLRSHLWISYVACWIGHCWRKKKKERERERMLSSSLQDSNPRTHHHLTWKKCIFMCPSFPCCFWAPDFTRIIAILWAEPSTAISSMEEVIWWVYYKFEYMSKCEVAQSKVLLSWWVCYLIAPRRIYFAKLL